MANIKLENLELMETLEDDAATKVVGGVLPCTEGARGRVLAGLQASGLITAEQVATLSAIPLVDFCADFDDVLEARLGVKVFDAVA